MREKGTYLMKQHEEAITNCNYAPVIYQGPPMRLLRTILVSVSMFAIERTRLPLGNEKSSYLFAQDACNEMVKHVLNKQKLV